MRVFLIGYPGEMGGANTEAWHTIRLWRRFGVEVHLVPTWSADVRWIERTTSIGCVTHQVTSDRLGEVPSLPGSPVIGMCNSQFMQKAGQLRELGCPIVWVNCMTFLFDHEKKFFQDCGPADAMVYQSEFQRSMLEPQLAQYGYKPESGHLIRGAFEVSDFEFKPRPHQSHEPFVVGRVARPDLDKWSSNTWRIYDRIQYRNKRALMLGMNEQTHAKLGQAPAWADCLKPMAMPVPHYFALLHCTLPINGGARENWPRAGLEAMAAGVPIVAQNEWGWREMIEHGVTGFLGSCDEELAHYTAMLAYDENLRQSVIHNAYHRLTHSLAADSILWPAWQRLFATLC